MRIFIAIIVLIFSFQSWTKADDIGDFQVDGISIGDSLLDYFSEEKILNSIRNYGYLDNEFYAVGLDNENTFETFEVLEIHLKKDVHQRITKQERENLWGFLERNVDNCLVTNKYVLDYFEGKYPHCYNGYFYVSEEKMLTPIYMLAQKAIDKVIKYVKVKNESNKKVKRT